MTRERDSNDVSETDLLFTNNCPLATLLPSPGARRRDSEEQRRHAGFVRHPALTSALWNARSFGAGKRHPDKRPEGQAPEPTGSVPLNRGVSCGRGKCAAQQEPPAAADAGQAACGVAGSEAEKARQSSLSSAWIMSQSSCQCCCRLLTLAGSASSFKYPVPARATGRGAWDGTAAQSTPGSSNTAFH